MPEEPRGGLAPFGIPKDPRRHVLTRSSDRTDQDVTTLELADQSKGRFCLQVQNLSMAWCLASNRRGCRSEASAEHPCHGEPRGSPLRFEPCQRTRQNFYLPMPAESSRKIRCAPENSGEWTDELRSSSGRHPRSWVPTEDI